MINVDFLSGVGMATFWASGVFFLRFYLASKDKFYLFFCVTCWLLALERFMLFYMGMHNVSIRSAYAEANSWIYMIRLGAFLNLFWGIVQKNMVVKK